MAALGLLVSWAVSRGPMVALPLGLRGARAVTRCLKLPNALLPALKTPKRNPELKSN